MEPEGIVGGRHRVVRLALDVGVNDPNRDAKEIVVMRVEDLGMVIVFRVRRWSGGVCFMSIALVQGGCKFRTRLLRRCGDNISGGCR